jgi:hypothetical protein
VRSLRLPTPTTRTTLLGATSRANCLAMFAHPRMPTRSTVSCDRIVVIGLHASTTIANLWKTIVASKLVPMSRLIP